MKTRNLIGAALLALALAAAGPATAATVTVNVEPLVRSRVDWAAARRARGRKRYPRLLACLRQAWDGHWTGSTWHHYFNPYWCGNGSVVTYADPYWHVQDDEWLLRPERRQPVACRRMHPLAGIRFQVEARFSFNRRMDALLQRRPLHHALRLKWDSRPVTTRRFFLAVLAALVVCSALGAALAIVATDGDEPATTRVETTSP